MNFGQLKYAIEVADTGSFSKAAERLYISQPNLSRAIRELETSLGTTLFERSTKGTELTPDGEIFIRYAKSILQQLNDVETMFTDPSAGAKHFSISAPRASYAAEAFGKFSAMLSAFPGEVEAFYRETDSRSTIDGVMQDEYRLGMIRYPATYDKHFKSMLDDKKLTYELIAEFDYIILTSENSPLAKLPEISYEDLEPLTEISYPDPYLPSIPMSAIRNGGRTGPRSRRIYVIERASQFEILTRNENSFMWSSPLPQSLLNRYGLAQRSAGVDMGVYKDVLIYKNGYHLTDSDKLFISELCQAKRDAFKVFQQ